MHYDFGFDYEIGGSIDLTPLIDVVFLLLIFFIMATTFTKPVLDMNLATADSATAGSRQRQLTIAIDREGHMRHEGVPLALEEFPALLEARGDIPVNFLVDKGTPFEFFVKAVDIARSNDRQDFTITTEPGK